MEKVHSFHEFRVQSIPLVEYHRDWARARGAAGARRFVEGAEGDSVVRDLHLRRFFSGVTDSRGEEEGGRVFQATNRPFVVPNWTNLAKSSYLKIS